MNDFRFLLRVGAVFLFGVFLVQSGAADSDDYLTGDFIEADLVFEDGSFEMDRLDFQVDEFTGGAFTRTGQGDYSVQLEGSEGDVFRSQSFEEPDEGDILHFRFEEGFDAEYFTVRDGSGRVVEKWFIPDHVCLGEDLPYYCQRNGYGNRIDEVELSSDQLDWPRECRGSKFNESLGSGSYSGVTDSGSVMLPFRLEEGENVSVKFEVLNGSIWSLESFGNVRNLERGNLAYYGEWISEGEPVTAVYEANKKGVMCYSFDIQGDEVNTQVVVGGNSSDVESKALEWKALVATGDEPSWLYHEESGEKELNLSTVEVEEQDRLVGSKGVGSGLVSGIIQFLGFFS